MRHYDVADRNRESIHRAGRRRAERRGGSFSVSGGVGKDDYDDSYFGLQEIDVPHVFPLRPTTASRTASVAAASYNFERYSGPAAIAIGEPGPGERPTSGLDRRLDRARELLLDLCHASENRGEDRGAVSLRLQPRRREATCTRWCPDGPLPPPSQLPNVFNKLQQLHIDVRHRLSNRLAATVLVPLRTVPRVRLRVRSDRRRQHRPAELAGSRIRLPAVYGALLRVRREIFLVARTQSLFVEASC